MVVAGGMQSQDDPEKTCKGAIQEGVGKCQGPGAGNKLHIPIFKDQAFTAG